MKSRRILLGLASLISTTAAFGQGATSGAPDDSVYTRPGKIVAAGDGARLNLYCLGSGSPTVVFESGWEDWAPA